MKALRWLGRFCVVWAFGLFLIADLYASDAANWVKRVAWWPATPSPAMRWTYVALGFVAVLLVIWGVVAVVKMTGAR